MKLVLDPLSAEAQTFFERRTGPPVYQTRVAKTGWPTTCPRCGAPLLMEFVVDDQVGLQLTVEDCPCSAEADHA
jgi:hypothetical protein